MSDHSTRPPRGKAPPPDAGRPAAGEAPRPGDDDEAFRRLVRGAARDRAARGQFTAVLAAYALPDEQREEFLRRFSEAAGPEAHAPAARLR